MGIFQRDPIREEIRRISRESSRLGQTGRRLAEESSVVRSGRQMPISSVSPHTSLRPAPVLLVESRLARRKVILAMGIALLLSYVLFRVVAGWAT